VKQAPANPLKLMPDAGRLRRARCTLDPWSVDEACTFLENAQTWRDYLYGAYVLILVLGLRKGEVLGLTWSDVNLDTGELHVRASSTERFESVCRQHFFMAQQRCFSSGRLASFSCAQHWQVSAGLLTQLRMSWTVSRSSTRHRFAPPGGRKRQAHGA
jgi:hypothetical protein